MVFNWLPDHTKYSRSSQKSCQLSKTVRVHCWASQVEPGHTKKGSQFSCPISYSSQYKKRLKRVQVVAIQDTMQIDSKVSEIRESLSNLRLEHLSTTIQINNRWSFTWSIIDAKHPNIEHVMVQDGPNKKNCILYNISPNCYELATASATEVSNKSRTNSSCTEPQVSSKLLLLCRKCLSFCIL